MGIFYFLTASKEIPSLLLFSLTVWKLRFKAKRVKTQYFRHFHGFAAWHTRKKFSQRDFLWKLKELKRPSISSTKPLYCCGAPQYCTYGYNMAVWQLKSSKQTKFEESSRDRQNQSPEHTSLNQYQRKTGNHYTLNCLHSAWTRTKLLSRQHIEGKKTKKTHTHSKLRTLIWDAEIPTSDLGTFSFSGLNLVHAK